MHRSPEHNWEGYWLLKSGFEAYGGKSPDLYVYRTAAEAARREEKARRDNLIKAEAELERAAKAAREKEDALNKHKTAIRNYVNDTALQTTFVQERRQEAMRAAKKSEAELERAVEAAREKEAASRKRVEELREAEEQARRNLSA